MGTRIFLTLMLLTATHAYASSCRNFIRTALSALASMVAIPHTFPKSDTAHVNPVDSHFAYINSQIISALGKQISKTEALKASRQLRNALDGVANRVKAGDLESAYRALRAIEVRGVPSIQVKFGRDQNLYSSGVNVASTEKLIQRNASGQLEITVDDAGVFSAEVHLPTYRVRHNNENVDIFDPALPATPAMRMYRLEAILAAYEELGHTMQLLNEVSAPGIPGGLLVLKGSELGAVKETVYAAHARGELRVAPELEVQEADVYAYLLQTLGPENVAPYYAYDSHYPSRVVVDRMRRK